jgi:hypothetical protein
MEEGKKEFIEEWNFSVEEKNLTKKRTRTNKNETFKQPSDKPEVIINNIAEMSKEERRKCISKFLPS